MYEEYFGVDDSEGETADAHDMPDKNVISDSFVDTIINHSKAAGNNMVNESFGFQVKTKGNTNPKGKSRVYFSCHPDDFDDVFDKICEDVFASQDCAVYFTEDMSVVIPEENRETDLGRMNLFIIPVTLKLLSQPNRAFDSDFRFAVEKHIPVLPIMMEDNINELYSRPDKFGITTIKVIGKRMHCI